MARSISGGERRGAGRIGRAAARLAGLLAGLLAGALPPPSAAEARAPGAQGRGATPDAGAPGRAAAEHATTGLQVAAASDAGAGSDAAAGSDAGSRPLECPAALAAERLAHAAAARSFGAHARGHTAFALGGPAPQAEARLRPLVARLLPADAGGPPAHRLECRRWACKLVIEARDRDDVRGWLDRLQRDAALGRHTRGLSVMPRAPLAWPRPAEAEPPSFAWTVYLKRSPPDDPPSPALTPSSICPAELQRLEAERRALAAAVERDLPRHLRFHGEPPNPALTREIAAEVQRLLGAGPAAPTVECRGAICRLLPAAGDPPDYGFAAKLDRDERFRRRIDGGNCCVGGRFYEIGAPGRAFGPDVLEALATRMEEALRVLACGRLAPPGGWLDVRLRLAPDGVAEEDTVVGPIGLRFGGPLVHTDLGRCWRREIARQAREATLPAKISPAITYRRLRPGALR
jgi:hypothetical protein